MTTPQIWLFVLGLALPLLTCLAVWALDARAWRSLPPPLPDARWWRLDAGWRLSSAAYILLPPGMIGFMGAQIEFHAHDLVPILLIAFFFGLATPLMGLVFLLARYRIDAAGLVAHSAWGRATFVPWSQITQVTKGGVGLHIDTAACRLYVMMTIQDEPGFVDALARHLGQERMPAELLAQQRFRR